MKWVPTSDKLLEEAEAAMFKATRKPFAQRFVTLPDGNRINTIEMPSDAGPDAPKLVMIHGFGAAVGFWALNLDELAEDYHVYAFDLLGFGRSDRPKLRARNAEQAENWWVQSIEDWRHAVGLNEPFYLAGHSLGGYLATCYTLRYPQHVCHLLSLDPAGMPVPNLESYARRPWWQRWLISLLWCFPLLSVLRWSGPWGPGLIARVRSDIGRRFRGSVPPETVSSYIYHCNARRPTGERAFGLLFGKMVFAHRPLVPRLAELRVPSLTFVYGASSWMTRSAAEDVLPSLTSIGSTSVHVIDSAGHQLHLDQPEAFNAILRSRRALVVDASAAAPASVAAAAAGAGQMAAAVEVLAVPALLANNHLRVSTSNTSVSEPLLMQ